MKSYVWKVTLRCVDELDRHVDVVDYIEAADIDAAVTLAEARAVVRRLALEGTKSVEPGKWLPLSMSERRRDEQPAAGEEWDWRFAP